MPVLADRVVDWLVIDPQGAYWDATVGAGGHASRIARRLAGTGRLIGSDRDPEALRQAARVLAGTGVTLVRARFSELEAVWRERKAGELSGILFDLGIGSFQLDDPSRGFSFDTDGPLDMRMDPDAPPARDFLNSAPEAELAEVLARFGEIPRPRRLARAIARSRPLARTSELRQVVAASTPAPARARMLARVFQAIRMRVNGELEEIARGLAATRALLAPGGRIVVISYHSLEDRQVKQFFRREQTDCICPPQVPRCSCGHRAWLRVLTRRAEVPNAGEISVNRRARSAKLRVAEKMS